MSQQHEIVSQMSRFVSLKSARAEPMFPSAQESRRLYARPACSGEVDALASVRLVGSAGRDEEAQQVGGHANPEVHHRAIEDCARHCTPAREDAWHALSDDAHGPEKFVVPEGVGAHTRTRLTAAQADGGTRIPPRRDRGGAAAHLLRKAAEAQQTGVGVMTCQERQDSYKVCRRPMVAFAFGRLVRLYAPRAPLVAAAAATAAAAAAVASPAHALDSKSDRWYREWLDQELAEHPPAMKKDGWTALKVWSVIPQSANTKLVRFVFDDPFASAGMEVASYLLTRAFIGKQKEDGSRGVVVRPYTPSHTTIGYLELVVKGYADGKMSKHINSLKPGDTLEFKGPITGVPIIQNEFDSIGLIAGGSGITPMLQVAQRVLANPDDQTNVSLIFANGAAPPSARHAHTHTRLPEHTHTRTHNTHLSFFAAALGYPRR